MISIPNNKPKLVPRATTENKLKASNAFDSITDKIKADFVEKYIDPKVKFDLLNKYFGISAIIMNPTNKNMKL